MNTIFDICQAKSFSVVEKNEAQGIKIKNIFVSLRDFSQVDMDIRPFRTYTAQEFFSVRNLDATCQS